MEQEYTAENHRCPVCQETRAAWEMVPGEAIGNPLSIILRAQYPLWSAAMPICTVCLTRGVVQHLQYLLDEEKNAVQHQAQAMAQELKPLTLVARDVNEEIDSRRTLAERVSDTLTIFVGSWAFLATQIAFLVVWIILNSAILLSRQFDPYPFILLNLVFSLWASLQAPLIMMSQNRQDTRDRLRNANDYRVNLRAELEIQYLNRKIDQMLSLHWPQLMQIQQLQMELMQQLARNTPRDDEADA